MPQDNAGNFSRPGTWINMTLRRCHLHSCDLVGNEGAGRGMSLSRYQRSIVVVGQRGPRLDIKMTNWAADK